MRFAFTVVAAVAAVLSSNLHAQAQDSCAIAAAPGVSEQRLTSGGRERLYRLFVPPGYDGRTQAEPLAHIQLHLYPAVWKERGAERALPLEAGQRFTTSLDREAANSEPQPRTDTTVGPG